MSKKPRRKEQLPTAEDVRGIMKEAPPYVHPKPKPTLSSDLLADVRKAVLRARADVAHNVAELEAWEAEIRATIAFLRASQNK